MNYDLRHRHVFKIECTSTLQTLTHTRIRFKSGNPFRHTFAFYARDDANYKLLPFQRDIPNKILSTCGGSLDFVMYVQVILMHLFRKNNLLKIYLRLDVTRYILTDVALVSFLL